MDFDLETFRGKFLLEKSLFDFDKDETILCFILKTANNFVCNQTADEFHIWGLGGVYHVLCTVVAHYTAQHMD